jgi:LmbE family N-acetylglucosaminyl deacetylase
MLPLDHVRWLIVAAHYDDESLLFGDLLLYLASQGRTIHIAVVTDVAETNPPTTALGIEREPIRQACRLGAFARVCMDLGARSHELLLPQIGNVPRENRHIIHETGAARLKLVVDTVQPDVIVTHATGGDYPLARQNVDIARTQHRWASELCSHCTVPAYRRHPLGQFRPPHNHDGKLRLLRYYRFGCTQTTCWDAQALYPEFVDGEECYRLIS